jgi:hypothetical protein
MVFKEVGFVRTKGFKGKRKVIGMAKTLKQCQKKLRPFRGKESKRLRHVCMIK